MRVSLATHGGLAAAINLRRPPRALDTDALPPEPAQELRRLVAAAIKESRDTQDGDAEHGDAQHGGRPDRDAQDGGGPDRGGPRRSGSARDAMHYKITVEDGGRSASLSGSDTAMSPAFAALLSWIERHAAG